VLAEKIDMCVAADQNLRARSCIRLLLQQWQQSVRGGAADDFQHTAVSKLPKRREQIAFPFIDKETPACAEKVEIELRQLSEFGLFLVSFSLTRCEIDQKINMPNVTLAQKLILQHRAKCWRERHRELERHVIVHQSLHRLQERDVGLADCFEQPVFFEEMLVLWMPNERQMRMKNEREMASHA
jgi:hypothetical protein